jgi:dihydroorotate dehydrogenase
VLYRLARRVLFRLPAETAHRLTLWFLHLLSVLPGGLGLLRWLSGVSREPLSPRLALRALGLDFPSPLGLGAGCDKDAEAYVAFGALGFGFIEVGTLTALPQPGNPRPRVFRLPRDRALVNRMGFNNRGAAHAAERLAKRPPGLIVGANIGRSKVVSNDEALADYVASARALAPHADYVVINVSSPNTPALRELQDGARLGPLIVAVQQVLASARPGKRVPLLVKLSPDLANEDLDELARLCVELGVDGIIATNTSIGRTGLHSPPAEIESCGAGGLSGAPLYARSLEVLARLHRVVGSRLTLISVGGVTTGAEVWERLLAGASLVQIYTSLIYEGPELPSRIHRELLRCLDAAGMPDLSHAIGSRAGATPSAPGP